MSSPMKVKTQLSEQEYLTMLSQARDEVQVLYNKIQYDRSATPELTDTRRRLLIEAERDLELLKSNPYVAPKN